MVGCNEIGPDCVECTTRSAFDSQREFIVGQPDQCQVRDIPMARLQYLDQLFIDFV